MHIKVLKHPCLTRDGVHIRGERPVSIFDALMGCRVLVLTVDGPVRVTIPRPLNDETVLRLKGYGVKDSETGKRGDQFVKLNVEMPTKLPGPIRDLLENVSTRIDREAFPDTHRYEVEHGFVDD